jgi:putative ABC transport system substrate-binding protein
MTLRCAAPARGDESGVISRRALVVGAAATLMSSQAVAAAQDREPSAIRSHPARIGALTFGTFETRLDALREGLRGLGYAEGRDFVLEPREGRGQPRRLTSLARGLVALDVDVLIGNATPAVEALRAATSSIPIVMAPAGDALGSGLVRSLARPGGNVTGLSLALVEMAGKTVELLHVVVPGAKHLACLVHENDPLHVPFLAEAEAAAGRLGVAMRPAVVRAAAEIEAAVGAMVSEGVDAVVVQPILVVHPADRSRVITLALRHRLPTASGLAAFAEAGGLLTYASEFKDTWRRAATYVDRLLKGARPGDLPVERPPTFTLIINLQTAHALGLTIPPSVLARADRLVQ